LNSNKKPNRKIGLFVFVVKIYLICVGRAGARSLSAATPNAICDNAKFSNKKADAKHRLFY
jgi:hypothetical protein